MSGKTGFREKYSVLAFGLDVTHRHVLAHLGQQRIHFDPITQDVLASVVVRLGCLLATHTQALVYHLATREGVAYGRELVMTGLS